MRVLSVCVEYGVVGSGAYSALVLQVVEETLSGAGGKIHPNEMIDGILETIIAGLPISVRDNSLIINPEIHLGIPTEQGTSVGLRFDLGEFEETHIYS